MYGPNDQKFSIKTKKMIYYLASLTITIVMIIGLVTNSSMGYQTVLGIVLEIYIIFLMTKIAIHTPPKYLSYWDYEISRYTFVKYSYLSFFVMGYSMDSGNYWVNFLVVTLCIVVFIFLYEKAEENMIIKEINNQFKKQVKTSTIINLLLKLTGLLLLLIVIVIQFYRINRWWMADYMSSNTSDNSFTDNLIGIFIGIPMLLLITLIPTYIFFNAKKHVISYLITKNPENFRERYDFSKKDWYQ